MSPRLCGSAGDSPLADVTQYAGSPNPAYEDATSVPPRPGTRPPMPHRRFEGQWEDRTDWIRALGRVGVRDP
jgi:hypothetical protein